MFFLLKSNENKQYNHYRALIHQNSTTNNTYAVQSEFNFQQSKVKMLFRMRALYFVEHNNLSWQTKQKLRMSVSFLLSTFKKKEKEETLAVSLEIFLLIMFPIFIFIEHF